MAVAYFPSLQIGDPSSATDDHAADLTVGVRVKAASAPVVVSGLRWFATALTAGEVVSPHAVRKTDSVAVASGPAVTSVAGWNLLPFSAPMTLTSADEVYLVVEQQGSAKYTYTGGPEIDWASQGLTVLSGWGVWAYKQLSEAVDIWNASAGNSTGNWYGVDLMLGVPVALAVSADHSPSTAAAGATVTLSSAVTGSTGAVGYAWTQTGGPAVVLGAPSASSTTFIPAAAGTYSFQVVATDASGSATASTSIVITGTADVTAPTVPTGLSASAITASGATIDWAASTDANGVVGYRVYIGGVLYGTTAGTQKQIVGRAPDADMFVTVSAGDAADNWSAQSAPLLVHTLPASVPPPAGGAGVLWVKLDSGAWVATGGAAPDPDWLFRPETYGAKGDGVLLSPVQTTAGSAAIVCASAHFGAGDVGKAIMVTSANAAGDGAETPKIGTITAVADATHATMSAPATRTLSAASAFYATNDSQAMLDMMLDVKDYLSAAPNPHAVVELARRFYGLATKPVPDVDGSLGTWSRAQVPLPVNPSQTDRKWVVELRGQGGIDGATFTSWHQSVPQMSGAMLVSMLNLSSADYIAGWPVSVVGGLPGWSSDWSGSNTFNNTLVVLDGIRVMCPYNPGQIAYDLVREGQYGIGKITADVFSAPHGLTGGYMKSSNADGMGLRTNHTGYNDRSTADALYIQGYYTGAMVDEHCQWDNVTVIYSHYGLLIDIPTGGTVQHGAVIDYASIEVSDQPLYVAVGQASDPTPAAYFGLVIQMLDNEDSVIEHIHDPGNVLFGTVNLFPSGSSSTPQNAIVKGASHLTVNNLAGGTVIRS